MTNYRTILAWLLFWLVFSPGSLTGQTTTPEPRDNGQALNYAFVSPNTRENLTIDEAISALNSSEETNMIRRVADLACRLRSRPRVVRALGSWSDGAEHSVLVRITTDEPSVRYLLSTLGQSAYQKSVLYFHDQVAGSASMYILRPRKPLRNLKAIATLLDQVGIAFRTLVPTKSGALVYIVDLKRELQAKVATAAKRLKARWQTRRGKAEFIGDDDRQKAQLIFAQEIKEYEAKNPKIPATCRKAR